ncbi:carbamoyltransferase HypF [Aeromonas hydrophila]|uniref:Carbamoyltransferase HypF n=1 Tax=Aeromonas hydrophila subsp. hydrophila (strain ATCC 7966 / DSM 30187 / BCRC 13018 / CCUG 14551 / JCM 1027 / KCTC 2358 / NCIMB 9240 / NCTC 8049) TaxID=380703 RepID=A0KL72_AERHH|nr:carbamoyltransferase HypF [Aeromonas hydrophila]ABK39492.1 [NiFe] hydrogenase maturation protein HypF [Aeromonas hydrophila subsp. hydrophila ATCC 7966]MBS4672866.1 carbamoyltransferase HypF [Aeromonas hydrophila]OOD33522.1 carbamoyltransferase HypF [Aeromonas hydrophila]SUU28983.1 [NiFe] hydrogenase maturation protein HypF [Aeromonas hydrophila]
MSAATAPAISPNPVANRLRREFHIDGIVQGVGFRPFVYGLALRHGIAGYVLNDANGVTIGAEGSPEQLAAFARELRELAPPLSRIDHFSDRELPLAHGPDYDGHFHGQFRIKASQQQSSATVAISPDQGMCEACANDVANPNDRHHRYPFTNCTHCGPRYTIIRRLPYDRPHTAMAGFAMCPRCAAAYENPLDRRYHAQPVSCPECGPHLSWRSGRGDALAEREDALQAAASALQAGALIAVKGMGGYHLVCDARNKQSVARLRTLKRRERKPLAVMMGSLAEAKLHVTGCEAEWQLLASQARPITLLRKRKNDDRPSKSQLTTAPLAEGIAPGIPYLGVMLPYTPLHQLLLDACAIPLVATSANGRGSPILIECEAVIRELGSEIDGILDHNRPILHPCDDSLVQWAGRRRQTLRLARGYAPCTPSLQEAVNLPLLAVGAQQKNQLALAFGRQRIYSPYIGDLHSLPMQSHFEQTLATFRDLYDLKPELLVSDRHPGYLSHQWAKSYCRDQGAIHLEVQHHHAHLLGVMAEHDITGPVLGVAFDGTGLGDDGTLWGGELLLADVKGFTRVAHLKPFKLIGGEAAIREPVRQLLGLLFESYVVDETSALDIPAIKQLPAERIRNLHQLWQLGRNAPYTSSIGRLFDAVAALLGVIDTPDYEGEAGLLLEAAALQLAPDEVPFPLAFDLSQSAEGPLQIQWAELINTLVSERRKGSSTASLAAGFIRAISNLVIALAERFPGYPVALGGGVFQNRVLMDQLVPALEAAGRQVLTSETLPLNDGGIAAGQLWFAIHHLATHQPVTTGCATLSES